MQKLEHTDPDASWWWVDDYLFYKFSQGAEVVSLLEIHFSMLDGMTKMERKKTKDEYGH